MDVLCFVNRGLMAIEKGMVHTIQKELQTQVYFKIIKKKKEKLRKYASGK